MYLRKAEAEDGQNFCNLEAMLCETPSWSEAGKRMYCTWESRGLDQHRPPPLPVRCYPAGGGCTIQNNTINGSFTLSNITLTTYSDQKRKNLTIVSKCVLQAHCTSLLI